MNLGELFEQLSHGELRQMALGGSEASGIKPDDYPKVIPHINWALTQLHKKFDIRIKRLSIKQYEHISTYELNPKYSQTNTSSTEKWKYIKDSIYQPFDNADEPLKIISVYKEDGSEYILNDETNAFSLFTPTDLSIQIPYNRKENMMTVHYRAGHPKLSADGENVLGQEVNVSASYLDPLLLAIAGRYLTTSGNAESEAAGNNFLTRFELSCREIRDLGLTKHTHNRNQKAVINGWV